MDPTGSIDVSCELFNMPKVPDRNDILPLYYLPLTVNNISFCIVEHLSKSMIWVTDAMLQPSKCQGHFGNGDRSILNSYIETKECEQAHTPS